MTPSDSGGGRRRTLVIVTTGEPVASVAARRGSFRDLIVEAMGGAWDGAFGEFDARGEALPAPDRADAYVITGSAANVPNREPWMLRLEAWLRDVHARGVPTLGICFGHQILAQALGGEVQRNPRGREIGSIRVVRSTEDPLFEGVEPTFLANATHVDSVVRLPPASSPLAWSDLEPHQAIRFGPTTYGVQFHPEIDADVMHAYVEARSSILADERFDVAALRAAIVESPASRRVLRNFLRLAGLASPR